MQAPLCAELGGAAARIAAAALRALAARRAPRDHDAVAGRDRGHARARPPRRRPRPRDRAGSGSRMPQPFVSTTWRSVWQSPYATTRTRTSRSPGGSTVSSSTARRRVRLGVDDAAVVTSRGAAARRAARAAAGTSRPRVRVGDDVVAELEHRELVARHRRAGQPLGHASPARASRRTGRGSRAAARRARASAAPRTRSTSPRPARRARRCGSPPPARSTARAKYCARSSTQIGCSRCVPGPTIGVTGAKRASRTKVGRTPPSRPKTKLGRKITCSSPDSFTAALHLPLRGEVRHCVLRPLVEPERAREHEPPHARVLRRGDEIPRALRHHALEVLRRGP